MRVGLLLVLLLFGSIEAFALSSQEIEAIQLQIAKEREKAIQNTQPAAPTVNLQETNITTPKKLTIIDNETPCFNIKNVELVGEDASMFKSSLSSALKSIGFRSGQCIGANSINAILSAIGNEIIRNGFVTTRVVANPQDIKSGKLKLTVMPGKVNDIRFEQNPQVDTNIERANSFNAMPVKKGDVLNIRDIEQGLENFKRVPTVEADMQIVPSKEQGSSDVVIKWIQREVPFRLNLSIDDAGTSSTGKYQGGVTIAADNPFRLNDIFYFSCGSDVAGYGKATVLTPSGSIDSMRGNSKNFSLHYSIPYGYWLLSFNENRYNYHQAVAGANQVYDYSGHSNNKDISLSYLFQRNSTGKSSIYLKGWERFSDSFIEDAEITVQRRKTAGYEIGLTHQEQTGNALWNFGSSFRKGTGAMGSLPAPEEAFNEGTSRMEIITADASVFTPVYSSPFIYEGSIHVQYNNTPLVPQDRLSIGGRYTVRGFDGDYTLMADRGAIWRNALAYSYLANHQIYGAIDGGYVDGQSAKLLVGKTLAGAAIGLRGQFAFGGNLSYDIFAGTPIYKPDNFETKDITFGFSLNYTL
ncbi:MAG: ShlB/FhaC/HecB family hemolysin secretion/activation protein [Sulfurovaceae bacterium]|nr:ShlB/FhaC/HecB family hemolysin secretion/activation protein [Sulfurovaceae bacterium]